ncbi:MAG: cobalamin biosynthesis protein, partial [Casimicrobiaceae bacterium]
MNIIAIVVALGVEQWRSFRWRGWLQQAFVRYAGWLERRFNGGAAQQGATAAVLALAPPVLVAACGFWAFDRVNPLLGIAWNVLVLYLLVGFRHFSHAFGAIAEALKSGDAIAARRRLAAWRGIDASAASAEDIPKLAIEQGLEDSYRHVFGTLFWFLVLPGPAGAVFY